MKFFSSFVAIAALAGWFNSRLCAANPQPEVPPVKALATPQSPEKINPFTPIPEKFISSYFGKRPDSYLIDPQKLLSPSDFRDRLAFLNYHASDSAIDLFVFVIGADQQIPAEIQLEETIKRFFSKGRPAVVVVYYPKAAPRSTLHLSPAIADIIPQAELNRTLESAVMQANRKTNVSEQTEQFLVQLSIRIYWMEQMISGKSAKSDETFESRPNPAREKLAAKAAQLAKIQELFLRLIIPASTALGAIGLIAAVIAWRRFNTRHYFPVHHAEPRLGGDHAAGVGAVIAFASAAVPPAAQRTQVADFIHRS